MLALDLGIFHRKAHAVSIKEASTWTVIWVALAMIFNVGISMTAQNSPIDQERTTKGIISEKEGEFLLRD
jgi:hypothetical protein